MCFSSVLRVIYPAESVHMSAGVFITCFLIFFPLLQSFSQFPERNYNTRQLKARNTIETMSSLPLCLWLFSTPWQKKQLEDWNIHSIYTITSSACCIQVLMHLFFQFHPFLSPHYHILTFTFNLILRFNSRTCSWNRITETAQACKNIMSY